MKSKLIIFITLISNFNINSTQYLYNINSNNENLIIINNN